MGRGRNNRTFNAEPPCFSGAHAGAWLGWVGVEIFFVLSVFVIAYSAEGSSAFSFFRSRILRLMPAVWICASLVFAVLLVGHMLPLAELTRHYLKSLRAYSKTRLDRPGLLVAVR